MFSTPWVPETELRKEVSSPFVHMEAQLDMGLLVDGTECDLPCEVGTEDHWMLEYPPSVQVSTAHDSEESTQSLKKATRKASAQATFQPLLRSSTSTRSRYRAFIQATRPRYNGGKSPVVQMRRCNETSCPHQPQLFSSFAGIHSG